MVWKGTGIRKGKEQGIEQEKGIHYLSRREGKGNGEGKGNRTGDKEGKGTGV